MFGKVYAVKHKSMACQHILVSTVLGKKSYVDTWGMLSASLAHLTSSGQVRNYPSLKTSRLFLKNSNKGSLLGLTNMPTVVYTFVHTDTHAHISMITLKNIFLKRGSEIQQGFAFILMFKNVLQVCSATVHKCERSLKVFLSVEDLSPTPDMTSFLT